MTYYKIMMKESNKKRPSQFPEEIERVIEPQPYTVEEEAKITFDGRQFLIRIPNKVAKTLGIKKGDYLKFNVSVPHPKSHGEEMKFIVELKREK